MALRITKLEQTEDVFDVTVNGNQNFYANDVLVHNCEINLVTKALQRNDDGAMHKPIRVPVDKVEGFKAYKAKSRNVLYRDKLRSDSPDDWIYEEDDGSPKSDAFEYSTELLRDKNGASIALCTLSAVNWGNIKSPSDFEKPCTLLVRALDELLDLQDYPVPAAQYATEEFRPLGIGIINLAYFLAKNDTSYSDPNALALIDEYAEAWSYYLIKASADLAIEKGPCRRWKDLKYADGVLPIDTRKMDIDQLVPHIERMPWNELREQIKKHGIRNATLMALMPSETSSQISNATNGVEPPREFVSIKDSKDGILKQVVPEYRRLKNKYELLWDQKSPEGYLKICAVLQKYVDQGISVNTSYNPLHYPNEQIPMSEILKHMTLAYKYGIKQLYYFNTNDLSGEIDVNKEEADCDSCKI